MMLFTYLNQRQRELFMDLCVFAVSSDNTLTVEEEANLTSFAEEMKLTSYSLVPQQDLSSCMLELAAISTKQEKRVILFELLYLLASDGKMHALEQKFIGDFSPALWVDREEYEQLFVLAQKQTELNAEIKEAVLD